MMGLISPANTPGITVEAEIWTVKNIEWQVQVDEEPEAYLTKMIDYELC